MNIDLNSKYSSFVGNSSGGYNCLVTKTQNKTNDTAFDKQVKKEIGSEKNIYLDEIKNCFDNTTVTIKPMNSRDVQRYYQQWKNMKTNYSASKHDIILSPKVLEKMEKDSIYAKEMMAKIQKAATPEGFENAILYEYKVIVKDDGDIQIFACADFMSKNNKKMKSDDKSKKEDKQKHEQKRLEQIYLDKTLYMKKDLHNIALKKISIPQITDYQYFYHLENIIQTRSIKK